MTVQVQAHTTEYIFINKYAVGHMCDDTQLGVAAALAASASFHKINCVKFNAAKCRIQNREHARSSQQLVTRHATKNKL